MKILKIDNNNGSFYSSKTEEWKYIDQIDKDGLMELLNDYLKDNVEMDVYNEDLVMNPAQQIIYKSIYDKFSTLNENKSKFKDESERLYIDAIQKYKVPTPQTA